MASEPQRTLMNAAILADAPVAGVVARFLRVERIVAGAPGETGGETVRIAASIERREATPDTIWSGGWIRCETAHVLARKLGIPARKMGKLLDALDVKVRQCSLGCFE